MVANRADDSLPVKYFGEERYPKVYAWVERFAAETERKRKELGKAAALDGRAIEQRILETSSSAEDLGFIAGDPLPFSNEW
jgi:hypothetical protein